MSDLVRCVWCFLETENAEPWWSACPRCGHDKAGPREECCCYKCLIDMYRHFLDSNPNHDSHPVEYTDGTFAS